MRFLISMVFVGMLALSSQAFAAKIEGASAEKILINGKVVAQRWIDSRNQHHTRVTYKGIYYACVSDINQQVKGKLYLGCWTTHQLFLKLSYALETKAGLVKWYNGSFVMISWEFDPLIQHHSENQSNVFRQKKLVFKTWANGLSVFLCKGITLDCSPLVWCEPFLA